MSLQSQASPPQCKKALREVFNAIGFPAASWAAFVAGFVVGYLAIEPFIEHLPPVQQALTYIAVAAASALVEHLYVKPWNGSRILKSITKNHGPKTSAHVYGMFLHEGSDRPRINIPEIAKQYGERP